MKPKTKPKICVGIPYYGGVYGDWWAQLALHMSYLPKTVDVVDLLAIGAMAADHNRNIIADEFLKKDAEWLFWIDSDTIVPIGAVDRLLAAGKTLVSGLYYGKQDPHPPIAYYIYNGAYCAMNERHRWEVGEIIPVDSCGMGCMLTHRSVFEDIRKNYEIFQQDGGALTAIHKDDIVGEVVKDAKHKDDGKVIGGQYRQRLVPSTLAKAPFLYFALHHGKTEDLHFFEMARRVGHRPFLDTSVECLHLRINPFTGEDYRDIYGH